MKRMIFSVFKDVDRANNAIDGLREVGFRDNDISIVVQDSVYKEKINVKSSKVNDVAGGVAGGAATGGALGALVGLLAGLAVINIPGLGALLIAGPIASMLGLSGAAAATVSGAVTGAVAGGLIGALVGLGLPQKEAEMYESRVRQGDILLLLDIANAERNEQAESILKNNGAEALNYYTLH